MLKKQRKNRWLASAVFCVLRGIRFVKKIKPLLKSGYAKADLKASAEGLETGFPFILTLKLLPFRASSTFCSGITMLARGSSLFSIFKEAT